MPRPRFERLGPALRNLVRMSDWAASRCRLPYNDARAPANTSVRPRKFQVQSHVGDARGHAPAVYRVDWGGQLTIRDCEEPQRVGRGGETLPDPLQLSVLGGARGRPLSQRKVRRRDAGGLP